MKKVDRQILTPKDEQRIYEQEYQEKLEHLQHLKTVLAKAYSTCPADIIAKKKDEIIKLQEELEELEIKI
jgi:hypothetical protein